MNPPSLKLAMVSRAAHQSDGSSQSIPWDVIHGLETGAPQELLYDQLCNMVAQEERAGYKCCDYLRYYSPQQGVSRASKSIDEGCRTSICGWMYRVADHFAIDREVVSIAISYIDRILSSNFCADRQTFKLISATSFHLAIKVHFPHIGQEVGSLLPDLSRGDFGLDDLIGMERELVHSLTWLMNPVTTQSIAMHILSLLPFRAPVTIANTALFLAELSVCDYFFVTSRKSIVAIAAVMNASEPTRFGSFYPPHGAFQIPYQSDWHTHIEKLLSDMGYAIDWREVSSARERLWSLYRLSSESALEQNAEPPATPRKSSRDPPQHILQSNPSPTSCVGSNMCNFTDSSL
mmetsp:Transcript_27026/g.56306  ORF Transcript_27026/g.56306 Transcript_27026/m.56306 type:complete len:348 (+) Transcript_27026:276-1319(+)